MGFPSAPDRNYHESSHSPQFRCVELDCDFSKIGFNSRQALRKHRLKYHTSVNEVPLPRFGHRQPTAKRDGHHVRNPEPTPLSPPIRNHDMGGVRPRKKKYKLELRFCQEILTEIMKPRYRSVNQHFMEPVDMQVPTYLRIINKPMDLSTVEAKLDADEYEKAKDFEQDVRLIFKNCFKFNNPSDFVYKRGQELEKLFNEKWKGVADWLAARQRTSEPQSPGDGDDEDFFPIPQPALHNMPASDFALFGGIDNNALYPPSNGGDMFRYMGYTYDNENVPDIKEYINID